MRARSGRGQNSNNHPNRDKSRASTELSLATSSQEGQAIEWSFHPIFCGTTDNLLALALEKAGIEIVIDGWSVRTRNDVGNLEDKLFEEDIIRPDSRVQDCVV